MDGIHDLGGMQGFGAVVLDHDAPPFAEAWEGRVHGMMFCMAMAGLVSGGSFRHAIERMDPAHYLTSPYYEHWLTALADIAVARGVVTREELARAAGGGFPLPGPLLATAPRPDVVASPDARFAPGDAVRVREDAGWPGHTRCPRYVRGRCGTVLSVDGRSSLPDVEAHGDDRVDDVVYSVRFTAQELWGPGADPSATVAVGLWQVYLEAA
jgi:nitrile hydratase